MTFEDPLNPGHPHTYVEKFSTRRLARSVFPYVFGISAFPVPLRLMRTLIPSRLLPHHRSNTFIYSDLAGFAAAAAILGCTPPSAGNLWLFFLLLATEAATAIALALSSRGPTVVAVNIPWRLTWGYSVPLIALLNFSFWNLDGAAWRFHPVSPEKMSGVNPAAFLPFPDKRSSATAFHLAGPLTYTAL